MYEFNDFASTLLKIHHPKKRLISFNLYDYQKRLIKECEQNQFNILSKFRQGGFTTTVILWMLYQCIFKQNQKVLYLTRTDREATHVNSTIVQIALDNLPYWVNPRLGRNNGHEIEFTGTNSIIRFLPPSATCGIEYNCLIIDEAAFIPEMEQHWKAMYPSGKCIVMSTPNGGNWFYKTYIEALQGLNQFHVYQASYEENPEFDEGWCRDMKRSLGEKCWRQEYEQEFILSSCRVL